ncbi:MAG: ATP-binding cassette domain-containing protein, partial [Catalinimonas sp.]
MSVLVEHLTKTYGQQRAVDDISFRVGPGTILGFLGPNGAGKSTTMKIATGYLPPSAGRVVVADHDVATEPLEARRRVGYLPEHNPLYLDQYVHEYLDFMAGVHGLRGRQRRQRVGEMIGRTGLAREQGKRIGALSKGYRQRVGLAQALLHDPPVLILDEPTTGLDPNQIEEIRQLIREVGREKTVVFSTHILPEVQALCDRVVIVNRGKLVADGPVADLRGAAGGPTVQVAFARAVDPVALRALPGVREVRTLGEHRYEIVPADDRDLREAVFRA